MSQPRARARARISAPGLTLVEVMIILVILTIAVGLLLPSFHGRSGGEIAPRSRCAANLSGIYKAMYTYSVTEMDRFPIAGASDPNAQAIGFREGNRATGEGAELDNNATASLWLMVRDGSVGPGQWVCPSSGDESDKLWIADEHREIGNDEPQIELAGDGVAKHENTFDFAKRRNLSYSPINMHHVAAGRQWGSAVAADYVLMADRNDNDAEDRHTLGVEAKDDTDRVARLENSPNHGYEVQNYLRGDGSVVLQSTPFHGPNEDNFYAMTVNGKPAPPALGNSDGDAASDEEVAERDAWLLPLSGNGGVSLSGQPLDAGPYTGPRGAHSGGSGGAGGIGVYGLFIGVLILAAFCAVAYKVDRWVGQRKPAE